jgi:hypothetical protein
LAGPFGGSIWRVNLAGQFGGSFWRVNQSLVGALERKASGKIQEPRKKKAKQ